MTNYKLVQREPVAEEVTLFECASCNHLYQGHITQCDCMPDEQKFNRWLARPAEQQPAPGAITAGMLEAIWRDGFDAENYDDQAYCQPLIIARIAVEEAQLAPDVPGLVEALEARRDDLRWMSLRYNYHNQTVEEVDAAHRKQGGE